MTETICFCEEARCGWASPVYVADAEHVLTFGYLTGWGGSSDSHVLLGSTLGIFSEYISLV